jgi:soluble lytic murein transglycosylase-like protein
MSGLRALFGALLSLVVLMGAQSGAQSQADFTFRRVKVEKRPIGSLINIQITPVIVVPAQKQPATDNLSQESLGMQDWFWSGVSPKLEDAAAGRLRAAVQQIQTRPSELARIAPSLSNMSRVASDYGTDILMATLGSEVSPAFVLAMIGVESGGRKDARSKAGAVGLMQLVPATAARFDVDDSTDARQNIAGGVAYLQWLLNEFDRDPLLALAGYNAGENAVKKYEGVPPFKETRAYVPKVVAAWQVARALCMTPPDRLTDGCVFKTLEQP